MLLCFLCLGEKLYFKPLKYIYFFYMLKESIMYISTLLSNKDKTIL